VRHPNQNPEEESMRHLAPLSPPALALVAACALATSACGGPSEPKTAGEAPAAAAQPDQATQDAAAAAQEQAAAELAAQEQAAADLAAKEQELKAREIELELRQRELETQQQLAAQASAQPASNAQPKPAAPPAAKAPASGAAATATPKVEPPPPPPPVTVPAGTQLSVALPQAYSTKTNAVGQPVEAQLASDLVVGGRVIARAGAPIRGSITEVTSGSQKIGAVPALKIDFTQLAMADGSTMTINARINQKGQSEKGRDTAKIAGGTAAGAIIGHQINDGSGKVIGGIVGGAAGAIAAKKTGTEVEIPAGTVLAASLRSEFVYSGR
jgi:hypothetical protein